MNLEFDIFFISCKLLDFSFFFSQKKTQTPSKEMTDAPFSPQIVGADAPPYIPPQPAIAPPALDICAGSECVVCLESPVCYIIWTCLFQF